MVAAGNAPIADEALKRIAEIYHVETPIRGKPADERRVARDPTSRPLVKSLKLWSDVQIGRISGKSRLAEVIRYALTRWEGLTLFLDDGRVETDNDTVERAIRPSTLTHENALFAGSDGGADHWAVVASLIETCKLGGVEPQTYLIDVLTRIVNDHPDSRIDELLLRAYATPTPVADVA